MKTLYLCLFFLAGSAIAAPVSFDFKGQSYLAAPMGRSLQMAPASVAARLNPDPTAPDCDEIYAEIHRREYLFDDCAKQPDLAVCRVLKKGLRLLAEGRPDTDTPIDSSAGRAYSVAATNLEGVDLKALREAAALTFHVRAENVNVVPSGAKLHFSGPPTVIYAPDSAFAKVSKLVDFRFDDLARFSAQDRMLSQNSVLACDIAAGKASLTANAISTLAGTDHVPTEAVDAAWSIYRGLSGAANEIDAETQPLVKAALIGFYIARSEPPSLIDDPSLSVKELFRRLYDSASALPTLRVFSDREAMRLSSFPDIAHEELISQSWTAQ